MMMRERLGTVHLPGYLGWRLGTLFSRWTVMAGESGIYAEDIVKNSQGVVGLVLEDAEETTDESESDEEVLKKGQIVVCWYPSGNEETLSLSKVFQRFPGKFEVVEVFWSWYFYGLVCFSSTDIYPLLRGVWLMCWVCRDISLRKEYMYCYFLLLSRLFLNVAMVDSLNIKNFRGFFVFEGFCCFHSSCFFVTDTISWCDRRLISMLSFPSSLEYMFLFSILNVNVNNDFYSYLYLYQQK